eukprot:scaffold260649_cov19-Tisochrysis_lutea.AAC.1
MHWHSYFAHISGLATAAWRVPHILKNASIGGNREDQHAAHRNHAIRLVHATKDVQEPRSVAQVGGLCITACHAPQFNMHAQVATVRPSMQDTNNHANSSSNACHHVYRYVAYNKPEAVVDWLEHQTPEEEYVVVLDSDMTLRHPFLVEDLHPSPGRAIGARWGAGHRSLLLIWTLECVAVLD